MTKSKKTPKKIKQKRKLTAAQRRAKRERKKNFMTIFINGKQKRVPRPPTIGGMEVDEFIARNADPIWLHQNEMWELIPFEPTLGELQLGCDEWDDLQEFDGLEE